MMSRWGVVAGAIVCALGAGLYERAWNHVTARPAATQHSRTGVADAPTTQPLDLPSSVVLRGARALARSLELDDRYIPWREVWAVGWIENPSGQTAFIIAVVEEEHNRLGSSEIKVVAPPRGRALFVVCMGGECADVASLAPRVRVLSLVRK